MALLVALAGLPAAAPAGHTPGHHSDATAIRSANMSLVTSDFMCRQAKPRDDDRPYLTNHGGDIAFWGDRAVLACGADDGDLRNDGFVLFDVSDPSHPRKLAKVACVASASDLAIWGDLVFAVVDSNNETVPPFDGPIETACDAPIVGREEAVAAGKPQFQGIRIFSIADPSNPTLVANVATTSRGIHRVTVVPHPDGQRLVLYAANPGRARNHIVTVPLDRPADARLGEIDVAETNGCHDISVFLPRGLLVCNGVERGSALYDVRDDADDDGISQPSLTDPVFLSHIEATEHTGRRDHSSAFSWDGDTLVITDENTISLTTGSCLASWSPAQGVLWIYDVSDPADPQLRSWKGPHPLSGNGWCPPTRLNVLPLRTQQDVLVASWLGGGTTVVDFTNPSQPAEVGHYIADPGGEHRSFSWSSYWYNGFIYANNAWGCFGSCFGTKTRGLDVISFSGVSRAETITLPRLNFRTQECLPGQPGSAYDGAATDGRAPLRC